MQYKWLEEGVKHGGTLIVSRDGYRIKAAMYWTHLNEQVSGSAKGAMQDAMDSLDKALRDDAVKKIAS